MGRARELDPTFWSAQHWYGWAQLAGGHTTEALAAFEEATRLSERTAETLAALACGAARRRARALLADVEQQATRRFVSAYFPALVNAALGDRDAAFASFQRGVGQRTHWLMWIDVDRRIDLLHGDPRFEDLRRQVGLPPRA